MDKKTICKAINDKRPNREASIKLGNDYCYAYVDGINAAIEAVNQAFDLGAVSEPFIARMERIDTAAVVGDEISEEDRRFYNENLGRMKQEVAENAESWKYHSKEL